MSFCSKCGTKIDDGVKFCPSCGTPVVMEAPQAEQAAAQEPQEQAQSQTNTQESQANAQETQTASQQAKSAEQTAQNLASKLQDLGNTKDETGEYDAADIAQNKIFAILAYIGPLVLIPIFAAPKSKFARYHANQGLIMLLLDIAYGIVNGIILAILRAIFPYTVGIFTYTRGALYSVLAFVFDIPWILITVLVVLGIVYAAQGKAKELPIVGKFRILK